MVTRRENRIGVYHRNDVVPSADVVVERAGGLGLGPERISVPSESQSDKVGRVVERAQGLRVCHTPFSTNIFEGDDPPPQSGPAPEASEGCSGRLERQQRADEASPARKDAGWRET